jgi:hypothetical protein
MQWHLFGCSFSEGKNNLKTLLLIHGSVVKSISILSVIVSGLLVMMSGFSSTSSSDKKQVDCQDLLFLLLSRVRVGGKVCQQLWPGANGGSPEYG